MIMMSTTPEEFDARLCFAEDHDRSERHRRAEPLPPPAADRIRRPSRSSGRDHRPSPLPLRISRCVSDESDLSSVQTCSSDETVRHRNAASVAPTLERTDAGGEARRLTRSVSLTVPETVRIPARRAPLRHSKSMPALSPHSGNGGRSRDDQSRFFEAMKRSRTTQQIHAHLHTRRGYELMRKTNRTRKLLLFRMLVGDDAAPFPTARPLTAGAGRRGTHPSYGRRLRNERTSANGGVPTTAPAYSTGAPSQPVVDRNELGAAIRTVALRQRAIPGE